MDNSMIFDPNERYILESPDYPAGPNENFLFDDEMDYGIIFDKREKRRGIRRDQRRRIWNTTKAPFRYICHLEVNTPGEDWTGTGTLIGPRTVLTACHNIWDDLNGRDAKVNLRNSTISVIPGKRGTSKYSNPFKITTRASKLIPARGYDQTKGTSKLDYAIIHLKHPIGNKIGYWSMNYKKWPKDKIGTSMVKRGLPLGPGYLKVNLSGYPGDKDDGNFQYWSYNLTSKTTRLKSTGILRYLNDTFAGHSGSPVWVRRHSSMGGRVMVGIHVGIRSATESNPNKAVYLSSPIRSFIKRNTV